METKACFLLLVLAISVALPYMYTYHAWNTNDKDEFYFGVTYGFNSTTEAKLLIDKVKPYTNLFVVDSWDLATNESLLNEVCDYAAAAGLNFIVYFDLISQTTYPWHQDWFIWHKRDGATNSWASTSMMSSEENRLMTKNIL